MDSLKRGLFLMVPFLLVVWLGGCGQPLQKTADLVAPPRGFLHASWGMSVEEVKEAIRKDGHRWFQDTTDKPPYALYASGDQWDFSAILSYFFTPLTRKLYRVDVTFGDLRAYEKARAELLQAYKGPAYVQKGVEHWSWGDRSLVILQQDSASVQVSFSSGPWLLLNQQESPIASR